MMITTFYLTRRISKMLRYVFLPCMLLLLAPSPVRAAGSLEDAIRETTTELENLWEEDACETVVVKKKGYPLASVACSGSFEASRRAKFLDVMFRHDFILEKESYKLRPGNGTYLYKTRHDRKAVYFKLYVRNAVELWPRNPVQGKQLAVHVQNVRSAGDILRWRTLGIPLTFAVTLGRSDSAELLEKLAEYKEEKWIAIPLEDDRVDIADGNLLTIADALNSESLADYLKALEEVDGFDGMSPLYCSRFCKNVPALRALLNALREQNGERETTLVDTDSSPESSFYETGRIMNFRTFRAYTTSVKKQDFCRVLDGFLASRYENASRVMAVDAGDETAFNCLRALLRRNPQAAEFVRVSQMSLTNPFH